ncbi:sensor of ECF-type sigma factor [Xanthomarina sp. F2636L]|uniref:sensor of ECF-type sigma factor n=1 Tax=Xanthomarina sp. F2636L TaxID=2996018 RepID=UPI00225E204B|nr:sensor of ECF-type sigma factor [Xanthomarina sp. F2636L]MCX7550165.1 sensor of ECF-type sigma factor [Xanthomarina sp. F2636L]
MKHISILILLISISLNTFGQDRHEKIKALKTAYITEQLSLTKAEAEKFWPIYNVYEVEKSKLKDEAHKDKGNQDYSKLSEKEANALLEDMIALNNRRNNIYNNLITDLKKVISAKKIVQLKQAEYDFNKKMFEEYRKRHHSERKEKP